MVRPRSPMDDPRESPAYTMAEVARYLAVPVATIRYWAAGREPYEPLIEVPAHTPMLLSFFNFAELHILAAIRRTHRVKMPSIRRAIDYLVEHAQDATARRHPLISREMETDGLDLFIEGLFRDADDEGFDHPRYHVIINITRAGQTAMRQIIGVALRRIERDPAGIPVKLYPFTRPSMETAPAMIVIDPALSGGRPVIRGTGLATQIIAERYKAGESVDELVRDYERDRAEIEEAIRCEIQLAA